MRKRVSRQISAVALALALLCSGCGAKEPVAGEGTPGPTPTATLRPDPPPTVQPSAPAEPAEPVEPDGLAEPDIPADYDYSQCVPQSEPVEDDYFADAAFIGDSRMDGFRLYSGLKQGDFIVKAGLGAFQVDEDLLRYGDEMLTALEALGRKEYAKVYLNLGVNELGMRDDQGYYDHYAKLVDDIRAQQPKAVIYVQLLTPVNEKKCGESKVAYYVTNRQIAVYNELLRQLAQDKRVFMVDPAQVLTDETGQPPYDTVTDGVHFTRETYARWLEYLKCHTVQRGERNVETAMDSGTGGNGGSEFDQLRESEGPL